MRAKLFLAVLGFSVVACNLLKFPMPFGGIPVEYIAHDVCAGVQITSNNDVARAIGFDESKEGRNDIVFLRKAQAIRIPDPKPQATTWYRMNTEPNYVYPDQKLSLDLTWKCLPDKEPRTVQFTTSTVGEKIERGLRITENASSPNGFDIAIIDFPR